MKRTERIGNGEVAAVAVAVEREERKEEEENANKSTYEYGDVFAESLDFNNVYRFVAHLQSKRSPLAGTVRSAAVATVVVASGHNGGDGRRQQHRREKMRGRARTRTHTS